MRHNVMENKDRVRKRNIASLVILIVFFLGILVFPDDFSASLALEAGQYRTSEVEELVEQFPAQNTETRDRLSAELLREGKEGILVVCRMLLPAEKGDDTRARYAVNALANYVMQKGVEREREMFAKALIEALEKQAEKEVQAFLLSQIQQTGKKESVKPLRKYLRDRILCKPAARALLAIGTPDAEKALLKALKDAPDESRITLVKALGELRSKKAVKKIIQWAESPEDDLRQVTLFALANIGDPDSEEFLNRVFLSAPAYERTVAPALYLLYARRLEESGHKMKAAGICRSLIENYTAPQESHIPCAALSLLTDALGEAAFEDLLGSMDSPNRELRARALELADRIPGETATMRLIEKMEKVPAEVQAQIIDMLGDRGDKAALSTLRQKMKSPRKAVKMAGITAAAKLGGTEVFSGLLALLGTDQEEEVAAVKEALLRYPSDLLIPEVAKLIGKVPPLSQVAVIEILSQRHAKDHGALVFAQTASQNDEVRRAALAGLENTVGERDVTRLVGMLLKTGDGREIRLIQNALVAAVNQMEDKERRADLILQALETADEEKKVDLLRPLSKIGGEKALQAVTVSTQSENPRVRTVALSVLADWPDFEAAEELFKISRDTEDQKNLLVAIRGYVRLVGDSDLDDEEKVEKFKEIMQAVSGPAAKAVVLTGLGTVGSMEAFRTAAIFLDDPELRSKAALALARISFSGIVLEKEISESELLSTFRKAAAVVEDTYWRQRLDGAIGSLLKEEGFVPLFNGRDLTGWKGLVGDPVKRAAMSPEELAQAQFEADEVMRAHWKVENATLVFDGRGQSLCTDKDYADFELFVDWKIEEGGDSGIYLRGSPQVQIWGPDQSLDGSGGLYNNQKGPSKPLVRADNPIGEWNTFLIRMIGERVTVYLNDVLVTDDVVMENYWERDKPIYSTGQIELQAHSTPLYFRNLYIREIPGSIRHGQKQNMTVIALSDQETAEDFILLFNGKDLTGWVGDKEGYGAENGRIVVHPDRGGGNLYTDKEYGDFILRFEFMLTPGANNGLGIRAPLKGDAAYVGMEIQILDNTAKEYRDLKPYQYHGSIYGVVPAKRGYLRPVGEWNTEEVIASGRRIKVRLNGTTIVDADIDEASSPQTMDGRDHPGLKRRKGHIGFLGHGSRVEFRNIRIKELK
jgi:HEAT repeat protein